MPRRILFLAPQVPYPPHQGTTICNYNLIINLAEDYEVHLLCFQQEGDDPVGNTPLPRLLPVVEFDACTQPIHKAACSHNVDIPAARHGATAGLGHL